MKTITLRLLCLLLSFSPLAAMAQSNIKSAFNAIIKCPQAQITESRSLDKDPVTQVKTGQCDIYNFVLPIDKRNLIDKAIAAFDKDSPSSYGIKKGSATKSDAQISLAVGDASFNSVYINEPGYEYTYMLFLAPKSEDADGKYRYAYAMNYKETGKSIIGKLVVTYATTLKYRQTLGKTASADKLNYQRVVTLPSGAVITSYSNDSHQNWFEILMKYLQGIMSDSAAKQTRIALATQAYRHITEINNYPEVVEADKLAAQEVLKAMIGDSKYSSDTVLHVLLQRCLKELK